MGWFYMSDLAAEQRFMESIKRANMSSSSLGDYDEFERWKNGLKHQNCVSQHN